MGKKNITLEILFSIIITVIIISIVIVISLNLKKCSLEISKKNEASLIAGNIIENIKIRDFNYINNYIEDLSYFGVTKSIEDNIQKISINGDEFEGKFFDTEIPNGYNLEITIENDADFGIVKNININVYYYINNSEENFEVETSLELENVEDCNSPIITDEYLNNIGISNYEVIPIKYSKEENCYTITKENDVEWYNYSEKKWAKILVFPKDEDIKEKFTKSNNYFYDEVQDGDKVLYLKDYIYVWIPNFSIKDGITYFRYQNSKKAIKFDFQYSDKKYLYLNKISEEIKDISEDCSFNGVYGVWRKLDSEDDEYYKEFQKTKFGPINLK
jgi:hypothetical protein